MPVESSDIIKLAQEQSELLGRAYGALQETFLAPLVKKCVSLIEEKNLVGK